MGERWAEGLRVSGGLSKGVGSRGCAVKAHGDVRLYGCFKQISNSSFYEQQSSLQSPQRLYPQGIVATFKSLVVFVSE